MPNYSSCYTIRIILWWIIKCFFLHTNLPAASLALHGAASSVSSISVQNSFKSVQRFKRESITNKQRNVETFCLYSNEGLARSNNEPISWKKKDYLKIKYPLLFRFSQKEIMPAQKYHCFLTFMPFSFYFIFETRPSFHADIKIIPI